MKWKKLYKESLGDNRQESPYIDIPKFREEIKNILIDATNDLDEGAGEYVRYMKDSADDYIDEYVDGIVGDTIKSFDKLVHRDDTSMFGNFADIKVDWEREHKGGKRFRELIQEIDAGERNSDTQEFKTWTIDWYFNAFGTYNLTYKWTEFLEEVAYDPSEDEYEDED